MSPPLLEAIARTEAQVILGPRTGAKTAALSIPVPLPPAIPGLDVTVARVETMRPDMPVAVETGRPCDPLA
jgi:beta-galactosidase